MALFDAMAEESTRDGADPAAFRRFLSSWLREEGSAHAAWIAWDGDRPIGMIWLASVARVPRPHLLERRSGDVQTFWVHPGYRDRGLGARMLDTLLSDADARGFERVVVHSSEGAVTLYERSGFRSEPIMLNRTRPS